MEGPISNKLREKGLDTRFLVWLEGKADRLPRIHAVRKVKGDTFAAAIRAAGWLRQLWTQPSKIEPLQPEDWEYRYVLLEEFLWSSLKWSGAYALLTLNEDLAELETVLDTLLPASSWESYRQDIFHLRRKGQPGQLPKELSRRPSGGTAPSEETGRMRAAVAYISMFSETPYSDLTQLWNEARGTEYQPDAIKDRLRKGHPLHRSPAAAQRFLESWRSIYYARDLRPVYPGRFPLSRELAELSEDRSGIECNQPDNAG